MRQLYALGLIAALLLSPVAVALEEYDVRVLEQRPQSREHFVQGLEIVDGTLYLSTGTYGGSGLFRYDFSSGKLLENHSLPRRIFAEGLTVLGGHIYQLTWQNRLLLVYERATLKPLYTLPLPGEGWGLTNNGEQLIYSDGSDKLRVMEPLTGRHLRTLEVTLEGKPQFALNELEWIDGAIWANVWGAERILIIDPESGRVSAQIHLPELLPAAEHRPDTDVLNGIAQDPHTGHIWVTGKRWPWLYRIELSPRGENATSRQESR